MAVVYEKEKNKSAAYDRIFSGGAVVGHSRQEISACDMQL